MVGMKFNDPHKIVMEMLTQYVRKELTTGSPSKTAEAMGNILAGVRTSRLYRRDVAEPLRNVIAREYLRGILADHHTV